MNDDRDRFLLDRRYSGFLESLNDAALGTLALALDGDLRDAFARIVGAPEGTFGDEGAQADPVAVGATVREGYQRRRTAHDTGIVLAEPCTQWCIEKLGDDSENPTLEQLHAVLPEAIDSFGLPAVQLMVIQYSRSLKGFRELVATDERFAVSSEPVGGTLLVKDEAEQAAKREARKARKAQKKK
ncbi:MAG: hypothetical protein ACO36A_02425 [Ilumatobacteraceae bacterium]